MKQELEQRLEEVTIEVTEFLEIFANMKRSPDN
jgi:hypothetical protein